MEIQTESKQLFNTEIDHFQHDETKQIENKIKSTSQSVTNIITIIFDIFIELLQDMIKLDIYTVYFFIS
jgi:hypothetical protein